MAQRSKLEMRESQAKFWHAFAFLAVQGQRDVAAYHIAMLTDPPEQSQVDAIVTEAAGFKKAS